MTDFLRGTTYDLVPNYIEAFGLVFDQHKVVVTQDHHPTVPNFVEVGSYHEVGDNFVIIDISYFSKEGYEFKSSGEPIPVNDIQLHFRFNSHDYENELLFVHLVEDQEKNDIDFELKAFKRKVIKVLSRLQIHFPTLMEFLSEPKETVSKTPEVQTP